MTSARGAIVLLFLLLPCGSAFATERSALQSDLQRFDNDLHVLQADLERLEQEEMLESRDEFLPVAEQSDSVDDRHAAAGTGTWLIAHVNGRVVTFTDVPRLSWFAPYVRTAAEDDILSGYRDQEDQPLGLFGPGDNVTIGQLAKIAVEAAKTNRELCFQSLRNVTASGSWSAPYIQCAESLGWAVYSDGSVDVERPARRVEVVVTLLQAFTVLFDRGSGAMFDDVSPSTEFSGAIERAALDHVVSGFADEDGQPTGFFGPDDAVTRAEAAKIIVLGKEVYGAPGF